MKEDRIKIRRYLHLMLSEVFDNLKDEKEFDILADILVDELVGAINEELHRRYPKASTICYELWN